MAVGRNNSEKETEVIPLGQRILERPFLLLALGMVTMVVFYTLWGLIEIAIMTKAPLP